MATGGESVHSQGEMVLSRTPIIDRKYPSYVTAFRNERYVVPNPKNGFLSVFCVGESYAPTKPNE
jgi:hypothetical protein